MEQTDKSIEQLEDEAKKASEALEAAFEKLESAQKELESKPDDEKLKKKVDGLEKAMQTAKTKVVETAKAVEDTKKALKDAQDENAKKETPKDGGDNPESADDGGSGEKKIRLRVRSKTGKPSYFRAGLRFTPVDAEYEVSEDVAEILKNDPWLDGKTAGGRERSLEYTTKFPPARDFAIAKLAVMEFEGRFLSKQRVLRAKLVVCSRSVYIGNIFYAVRKGTATAGGGKFTSACR